MPLLTESKNQIISPLYIKQAPNTATSSQIYFVLDDSGEVVLKDNYLACLYYAAKHPGHSVDCFTTTCPTFSDNLKDSEELLKKILDGKVVTINVGKNYFNESIICEDNMYNEIRKNMQKYDGDNPIHPEILDSVLEDISKSESQPVIFIVSNDDMSDEDSMSHIKNRMSSIINCDSVK